MISRRLMVAGVLSATLFAGVAAQADTYVGRWELLGSREVGLSRDHDVIKVGRYEGDFNRIRITVRNNAVYINQLSVIYANGGYDNIPIAALIPAGGSSHSFDLRGGNRHIDRIDMTYRSVRNDRRKARVEVWGRH